MKRLPTPILAFGQSRLDHRLPLRSHAYGQLSQGVLPKAIPTVCRSTQPSRGVCSPNSSDPWREMPPVMTGSAKPSTRPGILPATPHRPTGKRFSQQQSLTQEARVKPRWLRSANRNADSRRTNSITLLGYPAKSIWAFPLQHPFFPEKPFLFS